MYSSRSGLLAEGPAGRQPSPLAGGGGPERRSYWTEMLEDPKFFIADLEDSPERNHGATADPAAEVSSHELLERGARRGERQL